MNATTWRRRLGKLAFPHPADEARRVALDELMRRLSPREREELADLREPLDDRGLEGLTDEELDRLEALMIKLHDVPVDEGAER